MHNVYLSNFDTNLVRVFLAIWETRNITRAADELGLTQPSVSHALKRLRTHFDDPLFIRKPGGMVPTERAESLHRPFSEAFAAISQAMAGTHTFNPESARRTIRIAMSDVSEVHFLPEMLTWLQRAAPGITLESVPLRGSDILENMRTGQVDLALGDIPQLDEECTSDIMFEDKLVCIVRSGHPLARSPMDPETFLTLRHIDVGDNAPSYAVIEPLLNSLPVPRNIALKMRHQLALPPIVRKSELAAIFPRSLAIEINRNAEFEIMDLWQNTASVRVKIYIHPKRSRDRLIVWARDQICALFKARDEEGPRP